MNYCTTDDVYRICGIPITGVIESSDVSLHILSAEIEVDRWTGTRWLYSVREETTSTATGATDTTLIDTNQSWTSNEFADEYTVYIKSGTGVGQVRTITENTATTLTVNEEWDTNPDSTSVYEIFYNSEETEVRDGNGTDTLYTKKHPMFYLRKVEIDSTEVSTSNIYQYPNEGRLLLNTADAEVNNWTTNNKQNITLNYYYGVRPDSRLKELIREFTASIAGMKVLIQQIGGTYKDVATYNFPEFGASKGQPYVNIREVVVRVKDRLNTLKEVIPRYYHIG
jgi:hypothetical protein